MGLEALWALHFLKYRGTEEYMNRLIKLITSCVIIVGICLCMFDNVNAAGVRKNYSDIKFADCPSIVELYVGPDTEILVGEYEANPFNNMLHLCNIVVDPSNESYSSYKGCLYDKDKTVLICFPQGLMATEIPKTCVNIMPDALYGKSIATRKQVKAIVTRNNGGKWPGYYKYVNNPDYSGLYAPLNEKE